MFFVRWTVLLQTRMCCTYILTHRVGVRKAVLYWWPHYGDCCWEVSVTNRTEGRHRTFPPVARLAAAASPRLVFCVFCVHGRECVCEGTGRRLTFGKTMITLKGKLNGTAKQVSRVRIVIFELLLWAFSNTLYSMISVHRHMKLEFICMTTTLNLIY